MSAPFELEVTVRSGGKGHGGVAVEVQTLADLESLSKAVAMAIQAWQETRASDPREQVLTLSPKTREVMSTMLDRVCSTAREIRGLADSVEDEQLQLAHWLRHRADALFDATAAADWHLVETLSADELDESLREGGMDPNEVKENGVRLIAQLSAEHRARADSPEDEPAP